MAEWTIRAFQGQGEVFQTKISASAFAGTEALTATVSRGDTQAAVLTVTPSWTVGAIQTTPPAWIDLPFTGAQLAALPPGPYEVLVGLADGSAALSFGTLQVYPGPGGTASPFYRALATPAQARTVVPALRQPQIDMLMPLALPAATRLIEGRVGRPLVLDSYDHILRPSSGTNRLRLRTRPVVEVSRLASDVIAGIAVSNSGTPPVSAASVSEAVAPNSLAIATLTFRTVAAGTPTVQTLRVSDYPTWGQLAAAVNALGNGWGARVQSTASGLATADAFGSPGARSALNQEVVIHTHGTPIGQYFVDPDRGWLEINEAIPGGFLVGNRRVERSDARYWGVRATYRAGYATQAADVALGYQPVPEDLIVACAMVAYANIELAPTLGPVQGQAVKDRSYTLKANPTVIPGAVMEILARYADAVF